MSCRRCRLVVLGLEVGGRWSRQAALFVRLLARCRARAAPAASRAAAFALRWSALLAFAAARSFAASLLALPISVTANVDGESPLISKIVADSAEQPPQQKRREKKNTTFGALCRWLGMACRTVEPRTATGPCAERRKRAGQQLCVLGCEVGGRWNAEAALVVPGPLAGLPLPRPALRKLKVGNKATD